jgi:hypothetical protein
MGFFSDLFGGVASSLRTVVHVVADVASTATTVIKHKYRQIKEKYAHLNIDQIKRTRFDQLKEVNDEIIEYEKKLRTDGRLSEADLERLERLTAKRSDLRSRIENSKEFLAAEDIVENEDEYKLSDVDSTSPNELTRLGGQVMLGKLCPACNRPQVIRWKHVVRNPTVNDLFWGCTGLFVKDSQGNAICSKTQQFSDHDKKIFANVARPGMELKSDRLNSIILRPETSQLIKNKLSDSINETSENYLCPVHHEPMKLRTKSSAADLLDLYYLQCTRCNQRVKIKSATQLDAVLQSYDQKGLF